MPRAGRSSTRSALPTRRNSAFGSHDRMRVAEHCPQCGSEATTASGECRACGHVWGATHACVHCGTVCRVLPKPSLGRPCSACGLPRIAAGWSMPVAASDRLRRAVAKRKLTARVASVAFALAVVCMPLGLVSGGLSQWLTLLVSWCALVSFAALVRRSGRTMLSSELAHVERLWRELAELEKSPDRVRIGETRERTADCAPASARSDQTTGEATAERGRSS